MFKERKEKKEGLKGREEYCTFGVEKIRARFLSSAMDTWTRWAIYFGTLIPCLALPFLGTLLSYYEVFLAKSPLTQSRIAQCPTTRSCFLHKYVLGRSFQRAISQIELSVSPLNVSKQLSIDLYVYFNSEWPTFYIFSVLYIGMAAFHHLLIQGFTYLVEGRLRIFPPVILLIFSCYSNIFGIWALLNYVCPA